MTEFLRSWTMSLAGIIVFGSLCEMLLPNGVYKKYINLAVGLMLCIALISPFTKGDAHFDSDIASKITNAKPIDIDDGAEVLRIYNDKLCASIENEIKKHTDLKIDVKCDISEEKNSYGEIKSVWITVDASDKRRLEDGITARICDMYGVAAEKISVKYIR